MFTYFVFPCRNGINQGFWNSVLRTPRAACFGFCPSTTQLIQIINKSSSFKNWNQLCSTSTKKKKTCTECGKRWNNLWTSFGWTHIATSHTLKHKTTQPTVRLKKYDSRTIESHADMHRHTHVEGLPRTHTHTESLCSSIVFRCPQRWRPASAEGCKRFWCPLAPCVHGWWLPR